jgi:hypothetical protein
VDTNDPIADIEQRHNHPRMKADIQENTMLLEENIKLKARLVRVWLRESKRQGETLF